MASPPSTGSDPVKHSLPLQNGREMRNNGVSPTWPVENSERAELPQEVNKEERSKLVIDLDYLKQLETKITHLQHRVETCERGPESLAGSHISEPQISLVSDSAISQASTQRARRSRSPEIIENIDGPPITRSMGSIKDKEGNLKVSSLQIARWKCFDPLDSRSLENEDGVTVGKFPIGNVVNRSLVTVTQEYDRNKQFWRRRVEIASSVFYYLLKGMAQDNIDDFFLDGILYMVEPLMILFLNRKQLLQHLESASESAQVIEETRFILGFMKNEFSRESRTIDNFESATPPNMISYQDLWLLYRPGTLVFSHVNDGYEAFIVSFVEGLNTRLPSQVDRHGFTRCDVFCWSIDYDGEIFGRVWSIHCIAPFEGVRAIGSLALVPEKYLPNTNIVKESLISRGRHFLSLQGQHYREYANNQRNGVPTRVMIDQLTYSRRNRWLISIDRKQRPSDPNTYNIYSEWARYCQPNRTSAVKDRLPRRSPGPRSFVRPFDEELCFRDYKDDRDGDFEECQTDPYRRYGCDRPQQRIVDEFDKYDIFDPKTEVDELVLLLCPQHIRGFCFSDKVWKAFDITQLKPVSFREHTWDRLILDEEYRDVLEATVSAHIDKTAQLNDPWLGNGFSIVLRGEPGTGKTLLAETIAEHFKKPFFQVCSRDFLMYATVAEDLLEEISDYAVKWGAILLVDGADFLLQARKEHGDLKRSDLVAVFFRFIEKHRGVLFMTTNHVTRLDPAIQSRLDITIGLPPLDRAARAKIWHVLLDEQVENGTIDAEHCTHLKTLAEQEWSMQDTNGHQLKHALKTALVVAEKRGRMVGAKEIGTMLRIGKEFGERAAQIEKSKGRVMEKERARVDLEGFEEVESP